MPNAGAAGISNRIRTPAVFGAPTNPEPPWQPQGFVLNYSNKRGRRKVCFYEFLLKPPVVEIGGKFDTDTDSVKMLDYPLLTMSVIVSKTGIWTLAKSMAGYIFMVANPVNKAFLAVSTSAPSSL